MVPRLLFWSLGVGLLTFRAVAARRTASTIAAKGGALFLTLFTLPFWVAELFVLGLLIGATSFTLGLIVIAAPGCAVLFYQLLKAPALAGRRLLGRIEGFRLYLSVSEGDERAARGGGW
jgi:hypothetical protein